MIQISISITLLGNTTALCQANATTLSTEFWMLSCSFRTPFIYKWHSGNFLRLSLTSLARLDTRDCQLLPRNGLLLKVMTNYLILEGSQKSFLMLLQAQHKVSGQPTGAFGHQVNLTKQNQIRALQSNLSQVDITTSLHQKLPWFPEVSPQYVVQNSL